MVVYLTINLINNKKYVGMDTKNDPNYLGSGLLIKKAIKKYGKENFKKEILEYCTSISELENRETWWINYFDACVNNDFYNLENIRKRGINPFANKTSNELKEIFDKVNTPERSKKIGLSNSKPKPRNFSDKMSKIMTGKTRTKESKLKQGNKLKNRISPNCSKCIVYDKQYNLIGIYNSRVEAAKALDLNPIQISKVIHGKLKTTGGFKIKNYE
jgi:group I intron endonuclease